MIDHVLGRPSVKFRKYQVVAVLFVWTAYLIRGNRHGLPGTRRLSRALSTRLTSWQTVVITLLWLYTSRNFSYLVGLDCPEPLANLYTRSFFRATWITTALDAGFWSAMTIRRRWLREICSIVFSLYYLICAEQADEKVRKVRSVLTVDHLRVSWNKTTTPYLAALSRLTRPRFMKYMPRAIRIPRPQDSDYKDPVHGWLYYDGPLSALRQLNRIVLNIPGGGFVAMTPRNHDDALMAWAGRTGLPVLSLDYHKAPEHPYPYALNECYDVYRMLVHSKGRCAGLSGSQVPQVVISGDSAGGSLAAGLTLMILQSSANDSVHPQKWQRLENLPTPVGLVLIYPSLDLNIGNWMTDEQMALIRDRESRKTNRRIVQRKNSDYRKLTPTTPHHSDDEDDHTTSPSKRSRKDTANGHISLNHDQNKEHTSKGLTITPLKTRLATPSLLSYFSDRILNPEMMRAMILLYIGPHARPDFTTDYVLSPVLAPESLLAQFPKTYFLTGERDPLVDDTAIMSGRIRQAKKAAWMQRLELGILSRSDVRRGFCAEDHVEVTLIEGISHGFTQLPALFPDAWRYIHRVGKWYEDLFAQADKTARAQKLRRQLLHRQKEHEDLEKRKEGSNARRHRRTGTISSGDEDSPLEMSALHGSSRNEPRQDEALNSPIHHSHRHRHHHNDQHDEDHPPSYECAMEREADMAHDDLPLSPTDTRDISRRPSSSHSNIGVSFGKGSRSLVSLASEDDLLARRMRGLIGGLTSTNIDVDDD